MLASRESSRGRICVYLEDWTRDNGGEEESWKERQMQDADHAVIMKGNTILICEKSGTRKIYVSVVSSFGCLELGRQPAHFPVLLLPPH